MLICVNEGVVSDSAQTDFIAIFYTKPEGRTGRENIGRVLHSTDKVQAGNVNLLTFVQLTWTIDEVKNIS